MRRRLKVAWVIGVVFVGMVDPLGARAATPLPLFEQIGTLDRFPADARELLGEDYVPTWENAGTERNDIGAIVVPELRRLWQLYPSLATGKTGVVVRDLDTLAIVGTAVLPARFQRGTAGDWLHAVDLVHRRLFLVVTPRRAVVEVDMDTLAPRSWPLPASTFGNLFQLWLGAMTYDSHRDDLLLLWGGPPQSGANNTTFLQTVDVDLGGPRPTTAQADTAARVAGFHQMRSCTGPLPPTDFSDDNYSWEILVTEQYLYVPCQRVGHTGIVVRMARPTPDPADRPPVEEVAVGPVNVENAMADQAAGRIVMTTFADKEIWVFEAATMSFVGIAATAPAKTQGKTGYGLDRETGRVFFQSPYFGLGIVEARFFPLPQARTVDRRVEGRERILSDARTSRVLVLEGAVDKARAYRIYKVGPAPVPPPPPDPDRNTADIDEQAGLTEARFNAGASGYGARVVLAKGVVGVPPAPVIGDIAPTSQFFENSGNSRCGFTDRELVAGRVYKAEYDTGSAAAEAIAVDVDGATKQDLDKPSRCDVEQKDGNSFKGVFGSAPSLEEASQHKDNDPDTAGNESRWRWRRASCSSSVGDADTGQRVGRGEDDDLGPSSVSCPDPGGVLTAEASAQLHGALSVDGALSVGRAWARTRVERLPGVGVRSMVESAAQDVSLRLSADLSVTVAEIRSTAVSSSNGRPAQGNMSLHQVCITGVRVGGAPVDGGGCGGVQLAGLIESLNAAAAGRAVFRTGVDDTSGRDPSLLKGSKRGAQTAVQKSAARQASDRSLTGDFTVEVPGLEVLTFNDNTRWGRARQLYQFAGVASSATYNIVLLPTGFGFTDDSSSDSDFYGTQDQSLQDGSLDPLFAFSDQSSNGTQASGNVIIRAIKKAVGAVARGLRLFLTNPRQFLLLLTAWGLFSLAPILSRRRRLLGIARST